MRIEANAHAKINWALNITGRRADGYHLLDMLMQTIGLHDRMTFEEASGISLEVDGAVPADAERNLVVRAARTLNAYTGQDRGVAMTLEKHIPARAGLGGGSADCALTLKALNRLWGLGLDDATLMEIGAGLGADVPFCLAGGLARVSGIGERIAPAMDAPRIPLVLVTPGGGLSTAEVFGLWDRGGFPQVSLDVEALTRAVLRRDLRAVDALAANALTAPALSLMPEIGRIMDNMRALGAQATFMTGSGSTVVGAFSDDAAARRAADRLPGAVATWTGGQGDWVEGGVWSEECGVWSSGRNPCGFH